MQQLVLMFHVLIAVALIILVMLQQGKGAELGASFGSGASQTLFGSRGAGSFMLKLTGAFGLLFFITSLVLGYLAVQQAKQDPLQALSKMSVKKSVQQTTPALPPAQNSLTTTPSSVEQNPPTVPPVTGQQQ